MLTVKCHRTTTGPQRHIRWALCAFIGSDDGVLKFHLVRSERAELVHRADAVRSQRQTRSDHVFVWRRALCSRRSPENLREGEKGSRGGTSRGLPLHAEYCDKFVRTKIQSQFVSLILAQVRSSTLRKSASKACVDHVSLSKY